MRNQRGVSFLECIVSLGLFAVLLGALAMILRSQFQLDRAMDSNIAIQQTRKILLQLSAEWKGCEKLLQPSVSQVTNRLMLERIAPDQEGVRLPWPLPDLPISGWQANSPAHRQQITYEVRQSRLVRASTGREDVLLDQMIRLQVRQPSLGELRVQVDRSLAGKVVNQSCLVSLR